MKYFVCIHSVYSLIGGYPESDLFCIYPVHPLIGGYPDSDIFLVCIYPVYSLIGGYPDIACTTLRYQTFFFKVSEISGIFGQLSVDIDLAFLTVREQ